VLAELLGIRPGVTAVIGSGGKTSLLRTLGKELSAQGRTAVLCTTTHVFPFAGIVTVTEPDEHRLSEALSRDRIVCAGVPEQATGKLTSPAIPLTRLARLADYVLAEADGSHGLPLKAHAPHEPVIPPEAGRVVCVVGLSGLDRPIREAAHRPGRFAELAGAGENDSATAVSVARVLNAEALSDIYFINQADTPSQLRRAGELASLLDRPAAAGSLQKGGFIPCW